MSAADTIRAAWGEAPPDWVIALAAECDRSTQGRTGRKIGYSGSLVNQVLKAVYNPGSMDRIETAVRAALLGETVVCPAAGEIVLSQCLDHQRHAENGNRSNSFRARMYRACRAGCPNSRLGDGK